MFVMMFGIRMAVVLIIGMVILAVLIGVGGLGFFIFLGIDCNNVSLILIGVFFFVVFVIVFNFLLKVMEKVKLWMIFFGFVLVIILFGLFYSLVFLV